MKNKLLVCTLSAACLTLGSASVWSQDPDQKPIDCSTARDDINTLVHEHKSTDERIAKGVFSIMPIGIVLNTASSATESGAGKQKEMDIKQYNLKIDQRITDIKKTCNIQ
jgi:hypothetical protein